MKNKVLMLGLIMVISLVLLSGCAEVPGPAAPSTPPPAAAPAAFQWPDTLHFAATGASGEAKMISWVAVMQTDLKGPIIRVVNEAAWTNAYKDMAESKMVLSQIDKSTLRDSIEAINEYAMPDGGPWMAGMVWVDSLAFTGFLVRGDSDIIKPEDIKPGTRIAIWNDKSATLNPFRSLLAWANVNENDIVWVKTGDYDAGPRAVVEGRADISMAAPVSPSVMEASAAPGGIHYISLNPTDNPEGAKRFLQKSPLYDFGPIAVGPKSAVGTWAIVSYKYLGSNMETDTGLVYNIAKWLDLNYAKYSDRYESNKNMTLDDVVVALQTTYIPAHPGLVKYLQEKGIWNSDYETRNQKNTALFERYVSAYRNARTEAAASNIEIKPNNPAWIDFWENYKLGAKIPVIQMHASLTQDALVMMPAGYVLPGVQPPPVAAPSPTPVPPAPAPAATGIPVEVVSISDAHPGDDVTVTVKTTPGAEVTVLFTMPSGKDSAYPKDNTKIADAGGLVTWTWNINSHVPAGEATYTFTVKLDGKETVLTVKKAI